MPHSLFRWLCMLLAVTSGKNPHLHTDTQLAPPALLPQQLVLQYPTWFNIPSPPPGAQPTSWLSGTTSVTKSGRRILRDDESTSATKTTRRLAVTDTSAWTPYASPFVFISAPVGGFHGDPFDDAADVAGLSGKRVRKVILYGSKKRLTGISFVYKSETDEEFLHGSKGSGSKELVLDNDDSITKVSFATCEKGRRWREHTRVCGASFATKSGKGVTLGKTSNQQTFDVPDGSEIIGMSGWSGDRVDLVSMFAIDRAKITSIASAPSSTEWAQYHLLPFISYSYPFGGNGGKGFDGLADFKFDIREARVTKIIVYGSDALGGIKLEYDNGHVFSIGRFTGRMQARALSENERVTSIVLGRFTYYHGPMGWRTIAILTATFSIDNGEVVSRFGIPYVNHRVTESIEIRTLDIPKGTEFKGLMGRSGHTIDQLSVVVVSTSSAALPPK